MNGNEHRGIGDAASGGALVNLGGAPSDEQFWLSFGDVMALSGDYFRPGSEREEPRRRPHRRRRPRRHALQPGAHPR